MEPPANALPALSIRQPWAGLIVAGLKTIEIRTWSAALRGPLLIHAAKTRDDRPEAARHVTPAIAPLCALAGGIIGRVELIECLEYRTRDAFAADADRHKNAPAWFVPPVMYGLRLAAPVALPFVPWSGQTRFFYVADVPVPRILQPPEFSR